ncbi:hypothetical protein L227DRAFT_573139 [Lentinus tigrinus ALCF2SS1-6]|uniref:Lipoprotein n=1 Tax=Lentinus tigrinus ALCF2SS1-6 TaxID=1328759 RepID=A0A5C2SH85_9APHY|nr:hypothetical protein L227DRAFT_573139 [Lentinus tigrinus ALCF2SS1-6]
MQAGRRQTRQHYPAFACSSVLSASGCSIAIPVPCTKHTQRFTPPAASGMNVR